MSERIAEDLFNRYRKAIIKKYGYKGGMWDDQIDKFGKSNFGAQWGGCSPWDDLKFMPNKFYVANTNNSKGKGIHWIGVYSSPTKTYIYDSFARSIGKYGRGIRRMAHKDIVESDRNDLEQHDADPKQSDICGQLCLSWLCVVRDLGIRAAIKI